MLSSRTTMGMNTVHARKEGPAAGTSSGLGDQFQARFRVIVLAGFVLGIPVIGLGSRLAMFVLRLTSSDSVTGATSEDGFTIGEFTLAGNLNLLMMGLGFGMLGAAFYLIVKPFLVGPAWFRRISTGVGSGIVVASMVINPDSVDFVFLSPKWLAVSLFVALPVIFGIAIGPVVDRIADRDAGAANDGRAWVLPLALLAPFPLSWIFAAVIAAVMALWLAFKGASGQERVVAPAARLVVQVAFVAIAAYGLVALLSDVDAIV